MTTKLEWYKITAPFEHAEEFEACDGKNTFRVYRQKHHRKWRFESPRGAGELPSEREAIAHCQSIADAMAVAR